MKERYYRFARVTVRVRAEEGIFYEDEGALQPYAVPESEADLTMTVCMVDRLDAPEGACVYRSDGIWIYRTEDAQIRYQGALQEGLDGASVRIRRSGRESCVQFRRTEQFQKLTPKSILNCMEAEHLFAEHDAVLLHAACIEWEGAAVLFTAPSGTGKSTQADLWCRLRGAHLVNGDRAVLRQEREGIRVYGVPFSGSSGVSENVNLPLRAVVYLSQAPETSCTVLRGREAFFRIWEGCSINVWNRQDITACTQTVSEIVASVPVFHLACTPDASAVIALEQALRQGEVKE